MGELQSHQGPHAHQWCCAVHWFSSGVSQGLLRWLRLWFVDTTVGKDAYYRGQSPTKCWTFEEELSDLYKRYSKKVIESQIILDSWVVRKFLGFIKMKCRIRKPSTVPWWKRWEKSNHVYFTIGFSGCFFWTVFPFLYTNTCVNKWFRSPAYNVYQTLCPSVLRPKVEKFQQLCLLLDPSLEEGAIACDEQTYYLSHIWRMYKIWLGR